MILLSVKNLKSLQGVHETSHERSSDVARGACVSRVPFGYRSKFFLKFWSKISMKQ